MWTPAGGRASPTISPASTASASVSTASTVPSPRRRSGTRTRPLPSGPWPTNASRRCATRSTARVARLTIDREERATRCRGRWSASCARRWPSPRPTTTCASSCSPAPAPSRSAPAPTSRAWPAASGFTELHEGRGQLADLFRDLYALGKPTIARVQGYALAGGFGLALACDLVIAADDAVFGTPEIGLGLWPHMITVPMLRAMPPKRALELMLTGRRVDAAEADRIGFVTRVVPVDQLDAAVDELAARARRPVTARAAAGARLLLRGVGPGGGGEPAPPPPVAHDHRVHRGRRRGDRRVHREAPPEWTGASRHAASCALMLLHRDVAVAR